jgi:hypothetical protein
VAYYELSTKSPTVLPAVVLPENQRQVRGLNLLRSERWAYGFSMKYPYALPHFDRLGKYTGQSVYTLPCNPNDVVSISISTVYGRLKRYACSHNSWKIVRPRQRDILRAAAYYVLSKNSYFMDRILYFLRDLRKRGKLVHKTTLYFLCKSDADKRFVYGQVCFQTNWLIFRACRPRDKSLYFNSTKVASLETRPWKRIFMLRSMMAKSAEEIVTIGRPNGANPFT